MDCSVDRDWPADRWREAIQAWAEEKLVKRSWRYMARVIAKAPDEFIQKLEHSLSSWLQAQANSELTTEVLSHSPAARG